MVDINNDIESAITDPSTTLYNSPYFMRRLKMMISCSRRHKFPLDVIVINFKAYGEQDGESERGLSLNEQKFVLNTIGNIIAGSIRWDSDLAGRIDENNIGIMLSYCKKEDAKIVINRILDALKAAPLFPASGTGEAGGAEEGGKLRLSLKIGSSSLDLSHDALSILKEAYDNADIIETI